MKPELERTLRSYARDATGCLAGVDLSDLGAVRAALGASEQEAKTARDIDLLLYERIAAALDWSDASNAIFLEDVERHLTLRRLADNTDFGILPVLIDVMKEARRVAKRSWAAPPLDEKEKWIDALAAARDEDRLRRSMYQPMEYINPRHRSVARGINRLRSEGLGVQVVGGRATMKEVDRKKLGAKIDDGVRRLGGTVFAEFLFAMLRNAFDPEQVRHHVIRRVTTSGRDDTAPFTPFGYLFQLAAKHAVSPPDLAVATNEFAQNLLEIARAYTDTLDVRMFFALEGLFKDNRTLIPYLQEVVLFDGAYALAQSRVTDAAKILRTLFDWTPAGWVLPKAGCTVEQFAAVVDAVALLSTFRGPGSISASALRTTPVDLLGVDVDQVLRACAHEPAGINENYLFPADQAHTTFWRKPLIRDDAGYLILDPSCCAPAFFEVLMDEARALGSSHADREVGFALERLVRDELRAHGVASVTGKYDEAGTRYECDLVVETPEQIVLIEIKKKVLRRASKGGDHVALLVDVAESVFAAQVQAARHELILYRDGRLVLDDGGMKHEIVRGDRGVERIALTHLDHGSLQDRQVLSTLFQNIVDTTIRSTDPEAERKLKALERRGQQLGALNRELQQYRPMEPNPFFNCWFMSLGQLLVVLDHVMSPSHLWTELQRTRSVSFGSLDFYFEYSEMRRLR